MLPAPALDVALCLEDLSASSVLGLRLRVQPYVQLLELHYPVDDLAIEVREDDESADSLVMRSPRIGRV